MNILCNDVLSYIFKIILETNHIQLLPLTLVNKEFLLLIKSCVNEELTIHFKPIVRNNSCHNPIRVYDTLVKCYGGSFYMSASKIKDVLTCTIFINHIELFELLCITLKNSIKLYSIDLIKYCIEYNNNTLMCLLFDKFPVEDRETIKNLIRYSYVNKHSTIVIDYLIQSNLEYYQEDIIIFALVYDDLKTIKVFLTESNAYNLLQRAFSTASTKIATYISNHYIL